MTLTFTPALFVVELMVLILAGLISFLIYGEFVSYHPDRATGWKLLSYWLTPVTMLIVFCIFQWYYTNTASGIRAVKDWKSQLSNGLQREIIITGYDGREIFRYEGKFDFQQESESMIRFESEDGTRYNISKGSLDAMFIIEKNNSK